MGQPGHALAVTARAPVLRPTLWLPTLGEADN